MSYICLKYPTDPYIAGAYIYEKKKKKERREGESEGVDKSTC